MDKSTASVTWDDVLAADVGKIFIDRIEEGIRFVVMRGPCSLCAYVGVPNDHPLAGMEYDSVPIDCHGGLTYAGTIRELGGDRYWYGWDYAHCDDRATYYDTGPHFESLSCYGGKRWTPDEVDKDSWMALYSMKKLLTLVEAVVKKCKEGE